MNKIRDALEAIRLELGAIRLEAEELAKYHGAHDDERAGQYARKIANYANEALTPEQPEDGPPRWPSDEETENNDA